MASGRKNQLTKQIGEYLVAAELCRRGLIATTFTGNVPDFDVIATNKSFKTVPIQVTTIWGKGAWQFDGSKFLDIKFEVNGIQRIIGKKNLSNPDLICIFVRLISQGNDGFFIFRLIDLQEIIFEHYSQYLVKHNGKRPRNESSTHAGVNPILLERFRDNWGIIVNQKLIT